MLATCEIAEDLFHGWKEESGHMQMLLALLQRVRTKTSS